MAATDGRSRPRRSLTSTAPCAKRWPTRWTSTRCSRPTRPHGRNARRAPAPNLGESGPSSTWASSSPKPARTGCTRSAAYTGARRGELLYLRWSALDLDAAEVTFGGSAAVVRGQRIEGSTKGGRSRTVSLDRDTVAVLREHRRRQTEERLAAGSAWTDSGLVFTNRWGEPLYPDTVTALMTKLINRYNQADPSPTRALPHARLHDLRHLHATKLLLAGVPVHVVAARLGHADPAVTLRVYSHVLREQAAGVGDIFAQAVRAQR